MFAIEDPTQYSCMSPPSKMNEDGLMLPETKGQVTETVLSGGRIYAGEVLV